MQFQRCNSGNNNQNNDEAFLNLLSSQRELLNQLTMETAFCRAGGGGGKSGGMHHAYGSNIRSNSNMYSNYKANMKERFVTGYYESGYLLNKSIAEKHYVGPELLLAKRRCSLGFAAGSENLSIAGFNFDIPTLHDQGETILDSCNGDDIITCRGGSGVDGGGAYHLSKSVDKLDFDIENAAIARKMNDHKKNKKKRRLSSLGLVTPESFFEDNLEKPTIKEEKDDNDDDDEQHEQSERRITDDECEREKSDLEDDDDVDRDDDDEDDDEEDVLSIVGHGDFDNHPHHGESTVRQHHHNHHDVPGRAAMNAYSTATSTRGSRMDYFHVKTVMESFTSAMEQSQKSQQSIHDWDRKMGLKRSHSKTMRLTTRSRKKLRTILKKEINALSNRSNYPKM